VSTDQDPASARYGEALYIFFLRSIPGSFRSAWKLEKLRLEWSGEKIWSWKNEMLRFQVFQVLFTSSIFLIFGWKAGVAFLCAAFIGILLLETVNYVEHYGLRRKEIEPGVYEKVKPGHSWNSDHILGRIMLYELTRHSDHHYKATRKYQVLRHFDDSPQLPLGYPGSMVLAFFPPVWFRVMHRRLEKITDTRL
jgi:alkane 1-monooxygenase